MSWTTNAYRVFKDTPRAERHPVLSLIGICIGLPLLAIAGLFLGVALLSAPAVFIGWL